MSELFSTDILHRLLTKSAVKELKSKGSILLWMYIVFCWNLYSWFVTARDSPVPKIEELPEIKTQDLDTKLVEVIPEIENEELKDEGFDEIQKVISCDSQDLELESEESEENITEIPLR